ncbi:MAG TPA: DUF2231 domain-containing protein [Mycobacteriales bacterium]|nr:DUF2231 domain-containing protein [Mycobacteriales bacterium]
MPTISGLPIHPLVIHLVVVLLPLAALTGVAVAVVPALRRRYGMLVGVLNVAAGVSVPVAMVTGNELYDHRLATLPGQPNAGTELSLIEQHKDIANTLWPWVIVLVVGVLLTVALPRLAAWFGPVGGLRRPLAVLAVVVTLVGAVACLDLVVRIGEAGARAAWSTR